MSKLNIYDFVDKKKLDAVKKPIAQSHGLPNECYISKEYMSLERKKLFESMWTVIGVASSIPNIGDAKPFNLQDSQNTQDNNRKKSNTGAARIFPRLLD